MSSSIKRKLKDRKPVTVINPDHPSPSLVASIAKLGFDGIFIDCEHGAANMERVEDMARAARLHGAESILRPDTGLPWLITRYLHRGVDGVMVPLVHTAADAQRVVDTVRYAHPDDYEDKIIVLMIESVDGIKNLKQMLKIEGIDVFFIGPGDLSQSMGYPLRVWEGQARPAAVTTAVDRAIAAIVDAGKTAGTLVNRADTAEYIEKGVLYLYDHASHFLTSGAKEFLERVASARLPKP